MHGQQDIKSKPASVVRTTGKIINNTMRNIRSRVPPQFKSQICHSNQIAQCGRGDKHFEGEHCEVCVLHSNTKGNIHNMIHIPRRCQN